MPVEDPRETPTTMTVGEATDILKRTDLSRFHRNPGVRAIGVGIRDGGDGLRNVFILSVSDRTTQELLSRRYGNEMVEGLPIVVEETVFAAASQPVSIPVIDLDARRLVPKATLGERVRHALLGLRSLIAMG